MAGAIIAAGLATSGFYTPSQSEPEADANGLVSRIGSTSVMLNNMRYIRFSKGVPTCIYDDVGEPLGDNMPVTKDENYIAISLNFTIRSTERIFYVRKGWGEMLYTSELFARFPGPDEKNNLDEAYEFKSESNDEGGQYSLLENSDYTVKVVDRGGTIAFHKFSLVDILDVDYDGLCMERIKKE